MPIISVIVPVYNAEQYVSRCIDSILAQTCRDLELILVDDGSPDNAGAICDAYAAVDSRIRVLHQENAGVSVARNNAIDIAAGAYLMFVDSDDVIHHQCVEILLRYLEESGAQIAIGELARFDDRNLPDLHNSLPETGNVILTNLEALHSLLDTTAVTARFTSPCSKLYARELFRHVRFPAGKRFEDEVVAYQLYFQAEKTVLVDAELYYYYVNESGFTHNLTLQDRFDEYDAQWERLMFFQENGLDELLGKAAMTFLKTAQWDLITLRKGTEPADGQKKARFEQQYAAAFRIAQNRKQLDFLTHYDYFVLAQPKWTLFWRIKRQILLRLRRKE